MYDTIHLKLPIDRVGDLYLDSICSRLDRISQSTYPNGQNVISGHLSENIRVSISDVNISIKGSLGKYYFGNNFETLSLNQTREALMKMSDDLSLPIEDAKVTRIDFSDNLIMDYKPQAYYNYLGKCTYYRRNPLESNSLYYNGSKKTKLFYDKIAWAKSKKIEIPSEWVGKNVLRFEMRYEKGLNKQFSLPEVSAEKLYDNDFYLNLLSKWRQEYLSIVKLGNIVCNYELIKTPKDVSKRFELIGMQTYGYDRVMKEIENMEFQGVMTNSRSYSRVRNNAINLFSDSNQTTTSDLILELDKKINDVVHRGL